MLMFMHALALQAYLIYLLCVMQALTPTRPTTGLFISLKEDAVWKTSKKYIAPFFSAPNIR